jgi:hypothetical protein
MADEGYLVRLYDNGGQYIAEASTDQDLSLAANREFVIDSGGKIYVYNARNDQWREASGVITLASGESEVEATEPVEPKAPSKNKST